MQGAAVRVRDGQLDPGEALDSLLAQYVEKNHRTFQGLVLLPYELHGWAPSSRATSSPPPRVAAAIAVSHWSPPGNAWGRKLVLVVFTVL